MNPGIEYDYSKGLCPVTEKLYEKELMISPLVREGISLDDISDFANAIEKTIENINDLKSAKHLISESSELYDAAKAIEDNVKK
jgi:hypothetical protein